MSRILAAIWIRLESVARSRRLLDYPIEPGKQLSRLRVLHGQPRGQVRNEVPPARGVLQVMLTGSISRAA